MGGLKLRATARGIALLAVLIPCASTATQAYAAPKPINGYVGGVSGSAAGGLFSLPRDAVVYSGDDVDPLNDKVFVVEGNTSTGASATNRVQRLDRHGNFERAWGKDVIAGGAPGDTGTGPEICVAAVSGADNCQRGGTADVPGRLAGEFNLPSGVAIDQSNGWVYVVESAGSASGPSNARVQKFDLDGNFLLMFGRGVNQTTAGDICTSASGDVCGPGTPGAAPGQIGSTSVAFNNPGPKLAVGPDGDVFVADPGNRRVLRFNSDGTADPTPVIGGAAEFSVGAPRHIAVDGDGVLYAGDLAGSDQSVVRYDTGTGTFLAALSPSLLGGGATSGLEVDPISGNLLVARDPAAGPTVVQEVADPGAPLPPAPPPNPVVTDTHVYTDQGGATSSLAFSPTTGAIYIVEGTLRRPTGGGAFTGCTSSDPDAICSGLIVLATTTGPLSAEASAPSNVGPDGATVEGVVNPGGGVARYQLEVSRDGVTWTPAGGPGYVAGSDPESVSATVSGLDPNTFYRVRLRATKQTGISAQATDVSGEQVFLTAAIPPDATTLGSANRTDTSVQLRARIDPNGAPTTYRFEYGLAGGSFDRHVPIPDAFAGAGNSPDLVVQQVSGLLPGTNYHYRIRATNFVGTAVGEPAVFTTRAPDAPAGRGVRAYELVSPADKVGGVGVGVWYDGPRVAAHSGIGAHRGERFAVQGTRGAVLIESAFEWANSWAFAERRPAGWTHRPIVSRQTGSGVQTLAFLSMAAASPDLVTSSWSSNGHTPELFPEMRGWDLLGSAGPGVPTLLRDWQGRWELFSPTGLGQGQGAHGDARAVSADGAHAVVSTAARGITGPDDPTLSQEPNSRRVYVSDVSGGLSDTFPGAGARQAVNVCSNGTSIPRRLASGELTAQACPDGAVIDSRGASLGSQDANHEETVSADGSRIFFMTPEPSAAAPCAEMDAATTCPAQLYVRQRNPDGTVVVRWISRPEVAGQAASLLGPAIFEGATADGRVVFFRTPSPLTADDSNGGAPIPGGVTTGSTSPNSWDLYMYELADGPDPTGPGGTLTRVSRGPDGSSDCNVVRSGGGVTAAALRFHARLSRLAYFTCAAPLTGVPLSGSGSIVDPGGTAATTDQLNLYVFDPDRPTPADRYGFVTRLPRISPLAPCSTEGAGKGSVFTAGGPAFGDTAIASGKNCMRGTDGRLTLDDPDTTSGDIYAYDADRDELSRISAPQGGAGGSYGCTGGATGPQCYGDPGFGPTEHTAGPPQLNVVPDPENPGDRIAFFQSRSRLVAQDRDDGYDVYSWHNGELSLISTGQSATDGAMFNGTDANGRNVYFSTRDRLSWQDVDNVLDVYSARLDGGIPEPPPPPVCAVLAHLCRAPGRVPPPTAPDSAAPGGGGNDQQPVRARLTLSRPGRAALRRAARTGVLVMKVRLRRAGAVRAVARARLGRRVRVIARARQAAPAAGRATVRLRLNRAARRQLRRGRTLRVTVKVTATGSPPASVGVRLRRAAR